MFPEKKYSFTRNVTLLQLHDQEDENGFTGESPTKYEEVVKLYQFK